MHYRAIQCWIQAGADLVCTDYNVYKAVISTLCKTGDRNGGMEAGRDTMAPQ